MDKTTITNTIALLKLLQDKTNSELIQQDINKSIKSLQTMLNSYK